MDVTRQNVLGLAPGNFRVSARSSRPTSNDIQNALLFTHPEGSASLRCR
jgi:hypothetical protein